MFGQPQEIAGLLTVPTIDDAPGGMVALHVSISIDRDSDIQADDLDVAVSAGGNALNQTARPPAGALLPKIMMASGTAFGQFTFDNPGDAAIDSVTVSLQGESATFNNIGIV